MQRCFLSYVNLRKQKQVGAAKSNKEQIDNAVEMAAAMAACVPTAAHCAAHLTAARQRFENAVIFSGSA